MKKLKDISLDVNDLKYSLESLTEEVKSIMSSLNSARDTAEEIEDDIDRFIDIEESTYLNEKVWDKNNLDKMEFVSEMLHIAREVYDNLPNDENFDFRIKISERRVKY